MSLCLCIYRGESEIAAVEVGAYADFNAFRDLVARECEEGAGRRAYPTLLEHSDCDGEWSREDCRRLRTELAAIARELQKAPPVDFPSAWQRRHAESIGLEPRSAYESFLEVGGDFLIASLQALTEIAIEQRLPILFQ